MTDISLEGEIKVGLLNIEILCEMIPKSRGEDVRPVTLVGYEEGPHPLISGKVVVKMLALLL